VDVSLQTEISGIIQTLHKESSYEEFTIEYLEPIGPASLKRKKELSSLILRFIDENPSHCVAGTYCRGNIFSRPLNLFAVINTDKIIINASEHQILILENQANKIELEFLVGLLNKITRHLYLHQVMVSQVYSIV